MIDIQQAVAIVQKVFPTAKVVEARQADTISLDDNKFNPIFKYFEIDVVNTARDQCVCFTYEANGDEGYSQPAFDINDDLEQVLFTFRARVESFYNI